MNAASFQQRFDSAEPFNGGPHAEPIAITASPFRWPDPHTLPRRPWVFGRWLLRSTVSAIVAPGGVGKSSFVASMILSLGSGQQVLGKTVWGGPKRVWYWNLEDGLAELEMQLIAASMLHRVGEADCADRLFLDSGPEGRGLCIADQGRDGHRIMAPVVDALVAELQSRRIDVLIVDPFVSSHAVSENDNVAIDAVAKTWARVAKLASCSVVLVHHSKKLAGEKVTAESSRGASALVSAARVTLVLNRMDQAEATKLGVADDRERRRLFTVQDDKANRAPAEDAIWFRLASQDVGNSTGPDDPWGEDGDSVGVVVPWTPPDPFDGVSVDHLYRVQVKVAEGEWKESSQASEWVGKAVADVFGLSADAKDKADRSRISALLRTWISNGALVVVERRDSVKRELKKFVEVGEWAISAPPPSSGAGRGGASGAPTAPRPTCPPLGAGVGRGGAEASAQVGQKSGGAPARRVVFPANNSAFRPILAPGESLDDPVPGWGD